MKSYLMKRALGIYSIAYGLLQFVGAITGGDRNAITYLIAIGILLLGSLLLIPPFEEAGVVLTIMTMIVYVVALASGIYMIFGQLIYMTGIIVVVMAIVPLIFGAIYLVNRRKN